MSWREQDPPIQGPAPGRASLDGDGRVVAHALLFGLVGGLFSAVVLDLIADRDLRTFVTLAFFGVIALMASARQARLDGRPLDRRGALRLSTPWMLAFAAAALVTAQSDAPAFGCIALANVVTGLFVWSRDRRRRDRLSASGSAGEAQGVRGPVRR